MIAQVWPFERTAGSGKGEVRRLMRAVFCPSHAEIVKRFQTANRRTSMQLFMAAALAALLFQISTVPPFILTIWFIGLVTTNICVHLVRRMVIAKPASRWDIPILVAVNVVICGAWCAMPLALEFRSTVEMFAGIFTLMAILISAMVVAVQTQVWLINLLIAGGALLAPDIANLFSRNPHDVAIGVLIIKLLFLFNVSTLARSWHLSAKREIAMQAELAQRRKQAEELAAAKAMFLAHMSHEIRSPLAGVTLLASVLKRLENIPEDQRQLIEQIDAGGQAILNLLNSVLDYSKIEAGKLTLSPGPPMFVRFWTASQVSFSFPPGRRIRAFHWPWMVFRRLR